MNVWYKPRLQSVDNIIKTQVLGGEVSPKQIDAVHEEALDVVLAALNGEAGLSGPDILFCARLCIRRRSLLLPYEMRAKAWQRTNRNRRRETVVLLRR